jgi:pyridoxal phosphate enzyme (YggS family)
MDDMGVADSLRRIQDDIRRYAPDESTARDVILIAVSKNQPIEKIQAALDAGQRVFGENRVQEAEQHWRDARARYGDLRLHLIGPLQTNKVRQAVALFDEIHTLDREKLAIALATEMRAQNKNIPCFVQVNTGEEPQKSGISPQDLSAFLEFCRKECALNITGLMCIPPVDEPPALHFALLRKLAQHNGLSKLSMGMSGDYPRALALGATHIRVGSALFGAR